MKELIKYSVAVVVVAAGVFGLIGFINHHSNPDDPNTIVQVVVGDKSYSVSKGDIEYPLFTKGIMFVSDGVKVKVKGDYQIVEPTDTMSSNPDMDYLEVMENNPTWLERFGYGSESVHDKYGKEFFDLELLKDKEGKDLIDELSRQITDEQNPVTKLLMIEWSVFKDVDCYNQFRLNQWNRKNKK